MYDCAIDSGKTVSAPVDNKTIAKLAERTGANLKEANAMLDMIFDNLFGPRPDKRENTQPPILCLVENIALNADASYTILNRLNELNLRLFG